jgi:uncharacterized protein YcbK (DUF882 family)
MHMLKLIRSSKSGLLRSTAGALAICAGLAGMPSDAAAYSTSTSCLPSSVKSALWEVQKRFGKITVVSTHRPGARIAGSGRQSYHASCRAVDFKAPSGKHSAVVSWLKSNFSGGVGTYSCSMHHIHIDNGPYIRWHKCV